ncbi:MAG TPA: efflux RND transporter periplasmic adaptor subunit [Anaeromyxobacteraceae bacterium]|nr:efflux RND transporter periplasmic adaptor subunit [Anaeromyxobacteraceae bacterium]
MTKRRIVIVLAVLAVVAAFVAWRWQSGDSKQKLQFETAKVEKGRIVAKVTASGVLSALVTVQVGSQVSGRIASLHADFNTPVKKGQVIARIDPQLFQAQVDQARANLMAAEGNLVKYRVQAADARRTAQRQKDLAARKLNAQADVDTAVAAADAADAQVKAGEGTVAQARAALQSAEVNLAYTTIVSPTNGTVISRNVDVGQTVAASLQAPTIFVIAEDLEKMQVDTNVAEADVGRLKAGMSATFTVDAYPGEVFRGSVRQIRNASQTVQNVVTYDAVIDVDNPDLKLKPGMTANVTFVYAEKDDVLKVPNAALRFRPPPSMLAEGKGGPGGAPGATGPRGGGGGQAGGPGGAGGGGRPGGPRPEFTNQRTVWTLTGEKAAPAKVKTGISDGSFTEVLEGDLQAGQLVITDALGAGSPNLQNLRRGL